MENAPVTLKLYARTPAAVETALDPNTSYAKILQFIDGTPKVVDFGCGPGNIARFLAQRHCDVVGVDINKDHATSAREYCSDVLVADIESVPLRTLFPSTRFDVAIFADILEHLRDPARLLAEAPRILRAGGYVVASIPNIAHGAVRLSMLRGQFKYQELGILDETHLRFFTRQTIEELFERSGFYIEAIERTFAPVIEPSGTLVPGLTRESFPEELVRLVEAEAEATTLQFIVKAIPGPAPESYYHAAKQKNAELETRVGDLERQLRTTTPGTLAVLHEAQHPELESESVLPPAMAETTEHAAEVDSDLPTHAHYEETLRRLHETSWRADELQTQNEALRRELEALNDRAAAENHASAALANERAAELEKISRENDALQEQLAWGVKEADRLRAQVSTLKDTIALQNDSLRDAEARNSSILGERDAQVAARAATHVELELADARAVSLHAQVSTLRTSHGELLERFVASERRFATAEARADAEAIALRHEIEQLRLSGESLSNDLEGRLAASEAIADERLARIAFLESLQDTASTERALLQQAFDRRMLEEQRHAEHLEAELATALQMGMDAAAAHQLAEQVLLELSEKEERISEGARLTRRLEDEIAKCNRATEASNMELEIRKAALSDNLDMLEYAKDSYASLERSVKELKIEVVRLTERERELEETQQSLLAETQRLRICEEGMRERLRDGEQLLVAQTEELIAGLQAESTELSTLVDTVQSSHFWKFKRWLRRLRASTSGS